MSKLWNLYSPNLLSRLLRAAWLAILGLVFAACTEGPATAPPSENISPLVEEQILLVVEDYYIHAEVGLPEYEATLEAVDGEWARVAIRPVAVESATGPDIVYLQNTGDLVLTPTAEPASSEAANVESAEAIGWTIIAGPQAQFTDEELDTLGVPAEIRP